MALALDAEGQSFELHYYVRHRHEVAFSRLLNHGFRHGTVYLHCSAEGDSLRAGLPVCLHTPDRQTHIYVCGPQGFMASTAANQRPGLECRQIHQEAFAPMRVAGGEATAGVLMHEMPFEVEIGSSGQVFCIPVERRLAGAGCGHWRTALLRNGHLRRVSYTGDCRGTRPSRQRAKRRREIRSPTQDRAMLLTDHSPRLVLDL